MTGARVLSRSTWWQSRLWMRSFCVQLAATGRRQGDSLLGLIADTGYRDAQRSRTWSAALVRFALERPENLAVIRGWVEKWLPVAEQAIDTYCRALPDSPEAADTATQAVHDFFTLSRLKLTVPHMAFTRVCSRDDVWEGDMAAYEVEGQPIVLVYPIDGEVAALQGCCPHQQSALAEGDFDGHTVLTCAGPCVAIRCHDGQRD